MKTRLSILRGFLSPLLFSDLPFFRDWGGSFFHKIKVGNNPFHYNGRPEDEKNMVAFSTVLPQVGVCQKTKAFFEDINVSICSMLQD